MECDWEIELGGAALVIDALWPGFVDLRIAPERASALPEASQQPGLADALVRLNAAHSPVWTSKCDVWPVAEFDSDELDAPGERAAHAVACYIDLLPRSDQQWTSPALAEQWCRTLCARLRAVPLRNCRADVVIRRAILALNLQGLGITAYLTACGQTTEDAAIMLQSALAAFADSVACETPPLASAPRLK